MPAYAVNQFDQAFHAARGPVIFVSMEYFTNASTKGRVRYRQLVASAVGVLDSPTNRAPVGIAFHIGRSDDGLALWRLKVRGTDVPGKFIIDGGRFELVEPVPD